MITPRYRPSRTRPARRRPGPVRLTRRGRLVTVITVSTAVYAGFSLVSGGMRPSGGPPQPVAASAPQTALLRTLPTAPPAAVAPARTTRPASARRGMAAGRKGAAARNPRSPDPSRKGPPAPAPPTVAPLPPSAPQRVRIPGIGVDAPVSTTGLDARGWVRPPPPEDRNLSAWYTGSPAPGAQGTSVLVGHVDNRSGPAVFYGLGGLRKGSTVTVGRRDGTTAVFTVYGVEVFAKDAFPRARVYGATGQPELRVLTCGGRYSKSGGYSANVVVFARLTGSR